jgi:hypothetical protein
MASHNRFNGLGCLIGMIERNRAHVVVEHVSLDDAMEKMATDKSEVAINCRSGATNVVPGCTSVVRKTWVGVLKIGNRD